ncbi:arsenosugar biosynthesis radical SAM protein ArsS [Porticoccus sp. W117]|uniref:arsenosugar biosynthesis radical SAM (seleno)protein ArsS n=1 Tax=Porticoccus sp. W117 TaxID=3054777 RepID=UPI0025974325|nr:arsenosugar biosynthesis radical SAM (seleno)protein ArsS [Porticoccus sp. W117]MDM3869787.1 arsenosugar biosynthesis radical SAM protein ArsS [Porticoccus sp. W117]
MLDTRPLLLDTDFPSLNRGALTTLQVNLGYLCNLSCTHCHVNAGPKRTELMDRDNVELVLQVLQRHRLQVLDLTGGAPEMNPHFRYLVEEAVKLGVEVIDRCNLTILQEPGYEDLAEFLARHKVTVVASLPCYSEQNVNEQRGKGVFGDSIDALIKLNSLGYGIDPQLPLNLVYNPNGAFLPPPQMQLENDYKQQLREQYGIEFNSLFTITNMPISRFGGMLLAKGKYHDYMELLKGSYSDSNLETVMCHSLISVDWQGNLYDCDFNQMLELPLRDTQQIIGSDRQRHLRQLLETDFQGNPIVIGEHCYGCTAGQGSSCGGALED